MATIHSWERPVRVAAFLVALFTVCLGLVGLISPGTVTTARHQYFDSPAGLYAAAAVRLLMGLVLILSATTARAPRTLRLLGSLMCMQALSGSILGAGHARTVREWETMRPALLTAGALVALASGVVMVFALTGRRPAELNTAIP